jgi:hypothetical protein
MSAPIEGEIRPLPIDPGIVSQQAQSTIKGLVDAIVELITNSDDSYRRLEESGVRPTGEITVYARREKGGACRLLQVIDQAEGLDWEGLEKAVTFAASVSGFFEGHSVRGLFGRGLKEAIVGLGRGRVRTTRGGQESEVEIFVEQRAPKYKVLKVSRSTEAASGTGVTIDVLSPRIRCAKFDVLYRQLSHHFALRDILQDLNRRVRLTVDDAKMKRTRALVFESLQGKLRVREQVDVEGFGSTTVEIYESKEKLEFVAGDAGSVAGILVKTGGAILDSRLFGFEADEAAHHFYGRVDCPGIADVIREGDLGVLDPNRSGLDWRHQYCRSLDAEVKRLLRPLISEKRRQLEGKGGKTVREEYKKKFDNLCHLLNALAASELEDLPGWGERGWEITTLTIRPEVAYAEPNKPRPFSIYAPERLLKDLGLEPEVAAELADVKGNVRLLNNRVQLQPHGKHEGVLVGRLHAQGSSYGDHASVIVRLKGLEDTAELKIESPGHTRRRRLAGTTRGLFRNIEFDNATLEPIQRVAFVDGTVTVYLRFPPISRYLRAGGEGIDSPQGGLMLAELVAEAFCREVARRRIESVAPPIGGAEIDNFNSQVNQLMRKCLGGIHEALVA